MQTTIESTLSQEEVKNFTKAAQKAYSNMDFYSFCKAMKLNPERDENYARSKWIKWQEFIARLTSFDNETLHDLINFDSAQPETLTFQDKIALDN